MVEQAVVLDQDREEGLRRAHSHLSVYTELPNYRNSWLRQGFAEEDLVTGGTRGLADALVVHGGVEAVLEHVGEHLAAGADHVVLQVLGSRLSEVPLPEWRTLAPALETLR